MNSILFDTHAHYGDSRFETEFQGGAEGAIASAIRSGVKYILNASVTLEDSHRSIELAHCHEGMYASAGIHPEDCASYDVKLLDSVIAELEQLLTDEKVVAIGEIGLDYHWEVPHELQKTWLEAQLTLAREHDIPVIIHDREAHGDISAILANYPGVRGILHSFSGSAEMARELVGHGFYISFSGTVTYKNARKAVEAAIAVPAERLLVETDCPYLTPQPHRGEINYSGYLIHTAAKLAEIKDMEYSELCTVTTENAKQIYGIH